MLATGEIDGRNPQSDLAWPQSTRNSVVFSNNDSHSAVAKFPLAWRVALFDKAFRHKDRPINRPIRVK